MVRSLGAAEISFYQNPSYAFFDMIAISEKEGWYGDAGKKDFVSFIRFPVTRGLFRHWVLENSFLANVQGAGMLRTALPEAMTLGFLERRDGEESVAAILDKTEAALRQGQGDACPLPSFKDCRTRKPDETRQGVVRVPERGVSGFQGYVRVSERTNRA